MTNNTDSVSTLSAENKGRHVRGEFLKACTSLDHERNAIIQPHVQSARLFKMSQRFVSLLLFILVSLGFKYLLALQVLHRQDI